MAIIKCPECGREVSDKAPACPNCGYPIASVSENESKKQEELERYLDLAAKAVAGQNVDQVKKACEDALRIDPNCSRAWELEARGILFNNSLRDNNVMQAIGSAVNAVNCAKAEDKEALADSLYDSITAHIGGLYQLAMSMPTLITKSQYVMQVMTYYGELITTLPNMSKSKRERELDAWEKADQDSKKAFMPNKRVLYASHVGKPTYASQWRSILSSKGML